MGSRIAVFIAVLLVTFAVAGVASAENGGRPLSTTLTGANEAPGPGDPNASGEADLTLNQGQRRVCFDISWADVDGAVTAGHVHLAPVGVPGPVVVPLFSGSFAGTGATSGCVQDVDPSLIKAIRKHPSAYYVNVHSTDFQDGAVRGQLSK